jgi:hypothetical protein
MREEKPLVFLEGNDCEGNCLGKVLFRPFIPQSKKYRPVGANPAYGGMKSLFY